MTRCPDCGAHNPANARWCSQCLRRFEADPPASGPATASSRGADASRSAQDDPDAALFPAVPPAPWSAIPTVDTGAFLSEGGHIRWRCSVCEAINELDVLVCATCGTALAQHDRAPVDWDVARRRAVLAPGLGHLAAGRAATAWARLLLSAVWLLGALGLLATGGMTALAPAAPLLAGVAILWIGGVADVDRLAHGRAELISPRVLLWVVVAVLVGVLLTLMLRVPTPTL